MMGDAFFKYGKVFFSLPTTNNLAVALSGEEITAHTISGVVAI
jgi:hypothetical protein